MLCNIYDGLTTWQQPSSSSRKETWQLSERSLKELAVRDSYYQPYCNTLHTHRIPFTITGERALHRYLGTVFAQRDTEGLAEHERVDKKLYIVVDHVHHDKRLLADVGLATELESSWRAYQDPSMPRTFEELLEDWRRYQEIRILPGTVILLDARDWNMIPMTVVDPRLEAHIPPAKILFEHLLSQLLVTNHFSARYADCLHFAMQISRWMDSYIGDMTQDQVLEELRAPYPQMLKRLGGKQRLYERVKLTRAEHRLYLAHLVKRELTSIDHSQLIRESADEIAATNRRISRRDSCSLHDDWVSEAQQIIDGRRWLPVLNAGGLPSRHAPAWVREEYKAWEISSRVYLDQYENGR